MMALPIMASLLFICSVDLMWIPRLQVIAGINPSAIRPDYALSCADVNNDHQLGVEEAIFALQISAGLRN